MKYLIALLISVSIGNSYAQNINWLAMDKDQKNITYLSFGYDFEVLNNKNQDIKIEIIDQIPVASQDAIEVELKEGSGGALDKDSGEINWTFDLAAKQKKTWIFHYTFKYPNNKNIRGTK